MRICELFKCSFKAWIIFISAMVITIIVLQANYKSFDYKIWKSNYLKSSVQSAVKHAFRTEQQVSVAFQPEKSGKNESNKKEAENDFAITVSPIPRWQLSRWNGDGATCKRYRCPGRALKDCDKQPEKPPAVLVLGDSHALTLGALFTKLQTTHGLCFHLYKASACGPFVGDIMLRNNKPYSGGGCVVMRSNAVKFAQEQESKLKAVFLIARWEMYAGNLIRNRHGNGFSLEDRKAYYALANDEVKSRFIAGVKSSILAFQNRTERIVILLQIPVLPTIRGLPKFCLGADCPGTFNAEDLKPTLTTGWLKELEEYKIVTFIDPFPVFCRNNLCSPYVNGYFTFSDTKHLNNYGALLLQPLFDRILHN